LLNEIDDTHFRFRRDRTIVAPLNQAILTAGGLPMVGPEIALLYKSSALALPENVADFKTSLPHLSPEQRAWLRVALTTTAGEHPWLIALDQVRA
jgi:hypothetical protein